jgi:hypothetical protein
LINEIHSGGTMALDFQSDRFPFNRIVRAGVNSVLAALVANLIVRFILGALLDLPAEFAPLQYGAIAFLTILGTSAGAVVFALLASRVRNPIRTYWIVAMVALVLSICAEFCDDGEPRYDALSRRERINLRRADRLPRGGGFGERMGAHSLGCCPFEINICTGPSQSGSITSSNCPLV